MVFLLFFLDFKFFSSFLNRLCLYYLELLATSNSNICLAFFSLYFSPCLSPKAGARLYSLVQTRAISPKKKKKTTKLHNADTH
jgi:hypothetical protein